MLQALKSLKCLQNMSCKACIKGRLEIVSSSKHLSFVVVVHFYSLRRALTVLRIKEAKLFM